MPCGFLEKVMKETSKRGFTLIEIVITIAIFSIFVAFTIPPLIAAIRVAGHETSLLRMDQDAHRALNNITANLRGAILPILTDPMTPPELTPDTVLNDYVTVHSDEAHSFQKVLNSRWGFSQFGDQWRRLLLLDDKRQFAGSPLAGSDFVPFTVPVPYIYDNGESSVDSLDSNSLPQLGIRGLDGAVYNAALYNVVPDTYGGKDTRRRHLPDQNRAFHPYLGALDPTVLGLTPGVRQDISIADSRFALDLNLPQGADYAFGAIRFAPFLNQGQPYIVNERTNYDLNEDGDITDQYALGRIEAIYFIGDSNNPHMVQRPISSKSVLLQLNNRNEASYQPLFQLRVRHRTEVPGAPDVNRRSSLVLDVNMLMCDELNQRGNGNFMKSVKYLTRRYRTSVELRNMSLQ